MIAYAQKKIEINNNPSDTNLSTAYGLFAGLSSYSEFAVVIFEDGFDKLEKPKSPEAIDPSVTEVWSHFR